MIRLRQSTASQEVPLGPFVDATDGFTLEDALGPIAASDIKLWKNGASAMVNASGTAAFMVDGTYVVTLDATDTNTIGPLAIVVTPSGARPVIVHCEVLHGLIYDSMFGSIGLRADVVAIKGDIDSGDRLGSMSKAFAVGVAGPGATTTSIPVVVALSNPTTLADQADQLRNKRIVFTYNASNLPSIMGQGARIVSSTVPSGGIATLTIDPPLASAPNVLGGDIFVVMDVAVGAMQTADTAPRLPAALVGGRIDASVGAIAGSTQSADNLRKMGLASASGTLAAGSTTQVLNISAITPAQVDANQLRGRVVLIVDESGSEAALKIQGGRISSNTTTALTLEQPLTRAPAAGNVFIIV